MALSLFLGRFVGDFFSPPLSLPLPSRISVTRLGHMARARASGTATKETKERSRHERSLFSFARLDLPSARRGPFPDTTLFCRIVQDGQQGYANLPLHLRPEAARMMDYEAHEVTPHLLLF